MDYPLKIDGFENQDIRYIPTGKYSARITINGEPPVASENGLRWILTRDDGETVQAFFQKQSFFSRAAALQVGNKAYIPEGLEPMKAHEYIWCGLPIGLIFVGGGALGGLLGALGMWVNTRIFYNDKINPVLKYVLTLGITVGVVVLYLILGFILSMAISSL